MLLEAVEKLRSSIDAGSVMGLIQQESCITLKHKGCFGSTAAYILRHSNGKLKEQGQGIFQFTRAYRSSGKLRFDTLTSLKSRYSNMLVGLSWDTIGLEETIPLQITAGLLLLEETYNKLPDSIKPCNKLPMVFSAHNQGMGGLNKDRRACHLKKGCNSEVWFGNVADVKRYGGFSTRLITGTKTPWKVNRDGTRNAINNGGKYRKYIRDNYE